MRIALCVCHVVLCIYLTGLLVIYRRAEDNHENQLSSNQNSRAVRFEKNRLNQAANVPVVSASRKKGPREVLEETNDDYIVVLKESPAINRGGPVSAEDAVLEASSNVMNGAGLSSKGMGHVYAHALQGFSVTASESEVEAIRADPNVRYVVKDTLLKAFQVYTPPTGIKRVAANKVKSWDSDSDVVVAILDSGVDETHRELNVVRCDFFHPQAESCEDDSGHGTHVAGTVAGRGVGVAPGAKVWALKILHEDTGSFASATAALDSVVEAAKQNPNTKYVINMSLGGPHEEFGNTDCDDNCLCGRDVMHESICNVVKEGIPVIVAAGNEDVDIDEANIVPAKYKEVITVSAISNFSGMPQGDALAWFSNYGGSIDIAAPGDRIFSSTLQNKYEYRDGTSMAAPHVAGAALIYMSSHGNELINRQVRAAKVKQALLETSDSQCSFRGFERDKDVNLEPVLNVKNLELPERAVLKVVARFDQDAVYSENDIARLTLHVYNKRNHEIQELDPTNFEMRVVQNDPGWEVNPAIMRPRLRNGVIRSRIDLSTIDDRSKAGVYTVTVSVKKGLRTGCARAYFMIV